MRTKAIRAVSLVLAVGLELSGCTDEGGGASDATAIDGAATMTVTLMATEDAIVQSVDPTMNR